MSVPAGKLARYPRDLAPFRAHEAFAYAGLMALADVTGRWRYPARASGDLETMRFLDKVYWMFKSEHPIRRAARGSGLEVFFARQRMPEPLIPDDFDATDELRVSAVGDLMVHPYLSRSGESLYRDVADLIFGAHLAMGNLESVVLDRRAPFVMDMKAGPAPAFQLDEFRVVTGGAEHSYDFLSAACNHSLDFGEDGVASTIAALRDRDIAFHGVNEDDDAADRATILERGRFRLGLVSHTFGLNAHRPPSERPRIVNRMMLNERADRIDFSPLARQLRHCADAEVDFVVAHLHWGMEFEFYPRPAQRDVAHRIAELGVDAIIGHHPHVLQPVEYYRSARDPARVVPIFYSLGNLTVPFSAPYLRRSGVARIDLAKGEGGDGTLRTYVRAARVVEVDQVVSVARRELALRPRA